MRKLNYSFLSGQLHWCTILLLLILAPGIASGLSVNDLQTDFTQYSKTNTTTTVTMQQLDNLLRAGDIQMLMQKIDLLKASTAEQPNLSALKAIGYVAQNKPSLARTELSNAEKSNADQRYILYAQAMLLRINKKYSDAVIVIQKAIDLDKSHPYPWNILGRIQIDQQKYFDAVESFKTAVTLNKDFLPAYLNLGAAYIYLEQYNHAIDTFKSAALVNGMENRAHYGQALAYEKLQQFDNAARSLNKYMESTGQQVDSLEYLAKLQNSGEDYTGLINTGQILQKTDPDRGLLLQIKAHIYLDQLPTAAKLLNKIKSNSAEKEYLSGLYYIMSNDYNSALGHISTAIAKEPTYFAAVSAKIALNLALNKSIDLSDLQVDWIPELKRLIYYYHGLSASTQNKFEEAFNYWQQTENLIPSFSVSGLSRDSLNHLVDKENIANIGLGTFYYFAKLKKHALKEFESVVKKTDSSILGNFWLAQIQLEQGKRDVAQSYFKKSIQSNDFYPSLYALAELSYLNGKAPQAQDYYQRALKLKSDAGILIKLGLIYEQSGDNAAVEKVYTQLIEENKNLYLGYNQLAWFYTKRGIKLDQALILANKANDLQPGNSSILDTIGWIHYQNKNLNKAKEYTDKANDILPNNPTVLYHLGVIYKDLGEESKSESYLQQALQISSNFEEADLARKMLK